MFVGVVALRYQRYNSHKHSQSPLARQLLKCRVQCKSIALTQLHSSYNPTAHQKCVCVRKISECNYNWCAGKRCVKEKYE